MKIEYIYIAMLLYAICSLCTIKIPKIMTWDEYCEFKKKNPNTEYL